MAATTSKSDQITNAEAVPVSLAKTNEDGGRVRIKVFTQTTTVQDAGSTIRLCSLPKAARIVGGHISAPVMGGVGATLSVGVTGTVAKYLAATAIDAALNADLADKDTLSPLEELAADTEVIATTAVGATLAGKALRGYILYVVD